MVMLGVWLCLLILWLEDLPKASVLLLFAGLVVGFVLVVFCWVQKLKS